MILPYVQSGKKNHATAIDTITICLLSFLLLTGGRHQHPEENSFESIDLDITGIIVTDQKIWLLPDSKAWVIETPYQPTQPHRLQRFGELTKSKRHNLPKDAHGIKLITHWGENLLLINPKTLTMHSIDENYQSISSGTIAWDTLRPAADSAGEATEYETLKLRKNFRKAVKSSQRERIAGIWPIQNTSNQPLFFIATRIQGFPFIMMECDPHNLTRCYFARSCETDFQGPQQNWDGLGFVEPNQWLVFDKKKQTILSFRKDSCFHMPIESEFSIPEGHRKMQHMTTDQKNGFWFSTSERDPYTNSTIFYWPSLESFSKK
ncbi:MAG: hypothetical protein AB8C84_00065 [Oligoflexales bacterium]